MVSPRGLMNVAVIVAAIALLIGPLIDAVSGINTSAAGRPEMTQLVLEQLPLIAALLLIAVLGGAALK